SSSAIPMTPYSTTLPAATVRRKTSRRYRSSTRCFCRMSTRSGLPCNAASVVVMSRRRTSSWRAGSGSASGGIARRNSACIRETHLRVRNGQQSFGTEMFELRGKTLGDVDPKFFGEVAKFDPAKFHLQDELPDHPFIRRRPERAFQRKFARLDRCEVRLDLRQ